MINVDMNNIPLVQDEIEKLVSSREFLEMKYAGAEIPNYILPFPPAKQNAYNKMAQDLCDRLKLKGITVLCLNMYDCALEIMKNNESAPLEAYLDAEGLTKEDFFEDFSNVLDMNGSFAPFVAEKINGSGAEMVFMNGIGEAYPFVRIHALLEALPVYMNGRKPIVVFYPGSYDKKTGNSCFRLFDRLSPVNYYRAFNIFTEVN